MVRRLGIPSVGVGSCLVLLILLVVPYTFIDSLAVDVYYRSGILDAYTVALVAILALGAFALELTDEADLVTFAGACLALGAILLAVAALWAATVSPEIVMSLTTVDALAYHRWTLVAIAALVALVGVWNAYANRGGTTG